MARTQDKMIPTLFRYFMAASLMSQDFDRYLQDQQQQTWIGGDPMLFLVSKSGLSMCLWYGMLFVVIEGWQEAKLADAEVDRLLTSPNVLLLRRFRNGMFHFQKEQWLSPKLSDFCGSKDSVVWVRTLTKELRRFFLAEMKRISTTPATP
jgi:hypothetical protein